MSNAPARRGRSRHAPQLALVLAGLGLPLSASAEVVETDLRSSVFVEPSATSHLTVLNPALSLSAVPSDFLRLRVGYEADIVSGASEAVKGGRFSPVDVVSAATPFDDTRHVASAGFTLTRESTELSASYAYGTESDYRSHSITASAGTTFFQRNTEIVLAYGRGFDEVCTAAFARSDAPSSRPRLDSSKGCFTKAADRARRDVDLDTFQVGWTQAWAPLFTTQVVLTGGLQHGFLANPYRSVVIAPAGDEALENHPDNRARLALAARGKLYVRALETAFGFDARIYRDTWDVVGQTYELELERYFGSQLRLLVRGRYYTQTGALFYSDDYTGGEPVDGPRGQYWTGDRELSPLHSLLAGARIAYTRRGRPDARVLGALLSLSLSLGADVSKTSLEHFTWSGKRPDDTLSLLGSLGVNGQF